MFTVSPSLYSCDFLHLADQLDALAGIDTLHLDIDDGNFVRGISFGMELVNQVAAYTDISLDAHIESRDPMQFAEPLCRAGVWLVTAHIEALAYPSLFLSTIHSYGRKTGLALNIKTPVSVLEPYVDQLDQIILVSVEADCDGIVFRKGVLKKIRDAKAMLGPSVQVWVDGGVNDCNFREIVEAGADGVVMGRAIFAAKNPLVALKHYCELGKELAAKRDG